MVVVCNVFSLRLEVERVPVIRDVRTNVCIWTWTNRGFTEDSCRDNEWNWNISRGRKMQDAVKFVDTE